MSIKTLSQKQIKALYLVPITLCLVGAVVLSLHFNQKNQELGSQVTTLSASQLQLKNQLSTVEKDFTTLKSQDQIKRNNELQKEVQNIQSTFKKAVTSYENILKLQEKNGKTDTLEDLLAKALTQLSQKNYASADANLTTIASEIAKEEQKVATEFAIPKNVPVNNAPPSSGFSRQQVQADTGTYLVDVVSADLGSTRVVVDTASDSDCKDNCPVLSLGDYVSRSGAFAGINGSYFCPASYPSCAGKTNSFDTLAMNKNKKYLNSDNNVYSTVPAIIFLGGSVRYVGQSLDWGRDTGVDGVLANQPLLLSGGNITFGGSGDPKQGSKGSRSFVGSKGSTVYIGVVHNATVAEVAHVLKAMGLEGALNLDSGGSTALWSGGYKVGPGRAIPNAILFIRK